MQPISYRIALDVSKMASQQFISVKKGDSNHRLLITLMENGKPYQITNDCRAVFTAIKSNGAIIHSNCSIQANTIVYNIASKDTATAGTVDCEIILSGADGAVLTSPRFKLVVYETVFSEVEVESEEYPSLLSLVSQVNALIGDVSFKLENGEFKGEQGDDGISPLLKCEDNKLSVSHDEGQTWQVLQDFEQIVKDIYEDELPTVQPSDVGKVLEVNEKGEWSLSDYRNDIDESSASFFVKPAGEIVDDDTISKGWTFVTQSMYKVKILLNEHNLTKPYIGDCIVRLTTGASEKAILEMLELLNGDIVIYSNLEIDCKIILKGE